MTLGDKAKASLEVWENLLFDDVYKAGSWIHGCYSKAHTSSLQFIKSVCKSVIERGCEKSWRMVSFATFLKESFNAEEIPLYPFLGNRINIILLSDTGFFNSLLNFGPFLWEWQGKQTFNYCILWFKCVVG